MIGECQLGVGGELGAEGCFFEEVLAGSNLKSLEGSQAMGDKGLFPRVMVALCLIGIIVLPAVSEDLSQDVHWLLVGIGAALALVQVTAGREAVEKGENPTALVEAMHHEKEDLYERLNEIKKERNEVEHYFDTLMESVPSNVYFKDKESRFLKVNKSMAAWIGVGHPSDLVGKTDDDLFGPEHAEAARADEEKVMTTGKPLTGYVEKETFESGEETWVLTNKMPFRDRVGYVMGTFGISNDVTELVQTQQTLERERNVLRLLIDGFPDNIYIRDIDGKYLVANKSLANFVGVATPEEVVGKGPLDFFDLEKAEKALAEDQEVIKTGEPVVNRESILKSAKNGRRWLMISKVPVRDPQGKVLGVMGWNRDVTEQRRAAEELQKSEQRVQEIVDHCPAVISLKDLEGRFLMVNRRYEDLFNVKPEDLLGKTDTFLFDEKFAQKFQENDRLAMKSGEPTQVEEIVPHNDGNRTYVSMKFPLKDMEGNVYAIGGISTDITDRKKAEEAMKDLNDELVNANDDLRSAQEQLIQAEKLESVGRLAAGVAHEVKNPLAMIGMGLEFLTRRLPDDDEKGQETIHRMRRGVDRAKEIVKGLVDFSSARQLGLKEYEPNAIVKETILLVDYELRKGNVRVIKNLAEDLPVVMLDKTKIEQILVNLMMNAMHAMEEGGDLIITTATETLENVEHDEGSRMKERWRTGDAIVRIIIDDGGSGIDKDKLSKIFDPFFTTKETGVGTGLGLAVSRKIAELHGGKLELENRKGGGVRATLSLRAKRPS